MSHEQLTPTDVLNLIAQIDENTTNSTNADALLTDFLVATYPSKGAQDS